MSKGTKIFGIQFPVDPKILVGSLFALALGLVFFNFAGSSDDHPRGVSVPVKAAASANSAPPTRNVTRREAPSRAKQGVLRLKPVDPARSELDPTLKLWLLDQVRSVKPLEGGRNLFETGGEIAQANLPNVPKVAKIIPKPLPQANIPTPPPGPPPPPMVNIPLRYYGFVKPTQRGDGNRGYFMDGENILMATEGDLLESRFLVVALSPNTARVEDIQLKQGQDLQLIPEAISQ